MEYSASVCCGAPSCSAPAVWQFAPAFPFETPTEALAARRTLRCAEHLDLAGLGWLPGLRPGMFVILDPVQASPAATDLPLDELIAVMEAGDTERLPYPQLIDVEALRPGKHASVTVTETGPSTELMDLSDLRRLLGPLA